MTSKSEKKKSTLFEILGFGMKYTLAVVISILAISALCFISISVATHFSPPLQPMFDQERLGQLGDFLGGTLNPIFGFATVCLLLWSVFIQRKELSLTRDELKQSSDALNNQFNLATDDYNRKALEEELVENENEYVKLLNTEFNAAHVTSIYEDKTRSIPFLATNLSRVLNSATQNTNQVNTNVFSVPPKITHPMELRSEIEKNIEYKVDIYTQLITVIRIDIVRNNKRKKILHLIETVKKAGFISEEVAEKYNQKIGPP